MILKILLLIFSILTTNQEAIVLDEINAARQEAGVQQLVMHQDYTRVAQIRAADIALEWAPFNHYVERNLWSLSQTVSSSLGEALGQVQNIQQLVPALLDSPPHRKLLLKAHVTHIGIAIVTRNGLLTAVVVIGRPIVLQE